MERYGLPPRTQPQVLYEDRQVAVVLKPSGWLSQPDDTGDPCISQWYAQLLRQRKQQEMEPSTAAGPGDPAQTLGSYNPFVAPVHRLDRPVSGVLALARTSKAANRLTAQFGSREVTKTYLAVAQGPGPLPDSPPPVRLYLVKDRTLNRVTWSNTPTPHCDEAITELKVLAHAGSLWLVQMHPVTGRPHQLRATLASLDTPVVGDIKYGSAQGLGHAMALHAHELVFAHPTQGQEIRVTAPVPHWWMETFPQLFSS